MINIASKGDELLETRLNEATNPLNLTLNATATDAFCEQVMKEPEGPQIAVRLLAHKVQSPQEKEALYSFSVIDECVRKCGSRFHQEVGKFRFLNELIKVISPKYLALHMSAAVKKRCIECLYSLYKGIPHEPKLAEAYTMLKKQRIITSDPTYMDDKIFKVVPPTVERTKSIFETSKDSERLSRLLKSRNPEDLREANRIIKSVVQADNNKIEQLSKRQTELETMRNNIELLSEMLMHYVPGQSSQDDQFIMKELVDNLEKSRSDMFRLSRETEDDGLLNDVIKLIDECNIIIKKYWDKINVGQMTRSDGNSTTDPLHTESDLICKDLLGDSLECDLLFTDLQSIGIHDTNTLQAGSTVAVSGNTAPVTKYDELMNLFPSQNSSDLITPINGDLKSNHSPLTNNIHISSGINTINSTVNSQPKHQSTIPNRTTKVEYKGFEDLDILSKEMFNLNKKGNGSTLQPPQNQDVELLSSFEDKHPKNASSNDLPLLCNDLGLETLSKFVPDSVKTNTILASAPPNSITQTSVEPNIDLRDFDVDLSTIKPHPLKLPIVIYHNNESKVKVMLHFANDRPHPHITVMVAQISSENSYPVTDIVLKFAATKPIRIRKLTGTTNMLPSHSPFAPSTPINEVVLLYNASANDNAYIKYQLSYEINGESFLESSTAGPI